MLIGGSAAGRATRRYVGDPLAVPLPFRPLYRVIRPLRWESKAAARGCSKVEIVAVNGERKDWERIRLSTVALDEGVWSCSRNSRVDVRRVRLDWTLMLLL